VICSLRSRTQPRPAANRRLTATTTSGGAGPCYTAATRPAFTDLLGGQVEVFFSPIAASIEHIRASKLRALEALPDIPTVGDCVRGYEASAWQGVGTAKRHPSGSSRPRNRPQPRSVPERILLFCLASDSDWQAASITHTTAQQ
jgi:hypothetical protein